jgi:hypothetical protein
LARAIRWERIVVVRAHDVSNEDFDPVVSVIVALGTEDVSCAAARRPLLRFDDEKRVTVFFLVVRFSPVTGALLTADLCTSDSDRTQMSPATL